ncbi:MAG: 1-acyl-sn-glycerol-3-phosphate acyltransferase [Acidobacteria bacterium]|nr:1-acyl-sn-glycerol-3-phosphate acyltransferase [Acidobacteriota bacterium]
MLLNAIRWLRSLLISIPLIVLGTIAATTLGIASSLLLPRSGALERIRKAWARWFLFAAFVRMTVQGKEKIPSVGPVLFCCNHLSYIDPPALVVAMDRPVRFLAKDSLFRIPFLGWAMRREGDIPIERDNPRAAARSLDRAAAAARAGTSFVVFPEGARSQDGILQPFLSGAFRLAIQAHVPVVPIAIRGSHEALRPGSLLVRGGAVRILIGEPLLTEGLSTRDLEGLTRRAEDAICELLSAAKNTDWTAN